ncbi:Flp pilus assembly complex ATPase component TadA, partial [Patescibacteria group bacterium]|nr:Flp pilus assembly complex ATPase component TadA [Patescibacteria group bacterium]
MTILEALVQRNIVSPKDVPVIQKEMDDTGVTLDAILQGRGISEQEILRVKGEILEVPTRIIDASGVPFSVLEFIPEDSAIHYKFAPLAVNDGVLEVGLVDPDNIEARDALNFISSKINMPYKVFLISTEDFEKILGIYKGLSAEVTEALDDLDTELKTDIAAVAGKNHKDESNIRTPVSAEQDDQDDPKSKLDTKIVEDAPVTKIVATILRYATEGNASDIHIEHMRDNVRVRFRVDGVLNTSLMLPIKVHSALIARIKILSNMRLDEKRKPQDGRFSAKIEGKKIDFRVSTFPTYYGEKIV